jgi:hypothetical protein
MKLYSGNEPQPGQTGDWRSRSMHRRNFLRVAGASTAAASVLATLTACEKDYTDDNQPPANLGVNLGAGDVGILNYAFALEQLEAAFYTQVIKTPFSGITAAETALLTDIRDHEVAHREFFRTALGEAGIGFLDVNLSTINFSDRTSVLTAAKTFEDLGVAAYNGAGRLITTPAYLTLAGKIVSVEARHAAYIRNLLSAGSFADSTVVDANGLELSKDPATVLAAAQPFFRTRIVADNLPK